LSYYQPHRWLLVNNQASGADEALQVYELSGWGDASTVELKYSFDGADSGSMIGSASNFGADAVVYNYGDAERIIISDIIKGRLLVYRYAPITGVSPVWTEYK